MTDLESTSGGALQGWRRPLPSRIAPVLVAIAAIVAMALLTAGAMLLRAEADTDVPTEPAETALVVDEAAPAA